MLFQPEDVLKGLDERSQDMESLIRPDGTKKFPAKTCYDLFLDHKTLRSGELFLHDSISYSVSVRKFSIVIGSPRVIGARSHG